MLGVTCDTGKVIVNMKPPIKLVTCVIFNFFILYSFPAFSKSLIQPQNRTCNDNKECVLILIGCHCGYCARASDIDNGIIDSINQKYSKEFETLSTCSTKEMHHCSMAGACAITGKSIPICKNNICTVLYKPNSNQ